MSEPRRLNTEGTPNTDWQSDQERYERERQLAQANQTARRRRVSTGNAVGTQKSSQVAQTMAAMKVAASTQELPDVKELTNAQRQALAYRRATQERRRQVDNAQRRAVQPQSIQPVQQSAQQVQNAWTIQRNVQVQQPVQPQRQTISRNPQPMPQADQAPAQMRELNLNAGYSSRQAFDYDASADMQRQKPMRELNLNQNSGAKPVFDYDAAPPPAERKRNLPERSGGIVLEDEIPPRKTQKRNSDVPPPPPPRKGKGTVIGGEEDSPKGKKKSSGKKPKKKGMKWWQILLITLLVLLLIAGGTVFFILHAISPNAGGISLNQLLNTPKEFQDAEFNFVVVGIDRSTQKEGDDNNDAEVADGNTDMILYVHFNNETGELKMLQIPRDTICTTDRSESANYRINNVAKTQAVTANSLNIPALCEKISDMYALPIDGYMTIRLEMLVELVDLMGGVEIYVPQEMDYAGSHLDEGYQTLNGDACEFLLRTRKIYSDGDIGRLRMQRQFYSALFRRLKSIGNIWDVAKLTPAVINYLETDISASKLVSLAVSFLKLDSSKMMICSMPVILGGEELYYNGEAVVWPARQADADLLNTYFRENTGPVDASALNLVDSAAPVDLSNYTPSDPNVQFMGQLNAEADEAQRTENLDGSGQVVGVEDAALAEAEQNAESTGNTDGEQTDETQNAA